MITLGLDGWSPPAKPQTERAAEVSLAVIPTGAKGRISVDDDSITKNSLGILAPLAPSKTWRDYNLDSSTYDRMPVDKIIELMIDVSPEISRALWDFIRMVNPGWTLKVYKSEEADLDSEDGQRDEDEASKAYLGDFLKALKELYGSVDVVLNKIIIGGFLRGGFFAELVLAGGREAIDIATPDPQTLVFRKTDGGLRGQVWQFGQQQNKEFVALSDYATVKYVPIDPLPGKPHGRSLVHPALFPTLFLISLLRDLKRVVAQQGYPRLDIEIAVQKIIDTLGDELEESDEQSRLQTITDAVTKAIAEVKRVYTNLEPDEAYIHTDAIKLNRPLGTIDTSSLGAVDKLVAMLERMMVRALKTMPLLMSIAEGASEANANRQWEIHAAGIKSIQHLIEGLLESLLSVALRAAGLQGVVEFRFGELRAAEMLRDAQTDKLKIDNAKSKYNAGWISQDEAAVEVTGHKAREKEPRNPILQNAGTGIGDGVQNPMDAQADPGSNRMNVARTLASAAVLLALNEGTPTLAEERAAKDWWKRNAPDEDAADLIDAEVVEE